MNTISNSMPHKYTFATIIIIALFFLWSAIGSINGDLIKHFHTTLHLTRYQAGFVDSAFYLSYFIMALPIGIILNKIGLKKGILLGLILFTCGTLMFYPASLINKYSFFLLIIFIIGSGATFLETSANTLISKIGSPQHAAQWLNFAQGFSGLGLVTAVYFGGRLILQSSIENNTIYLPYIVIASVSCIMIILFVFTKIPTIDNTTTNHTMHWNVWNKYTELRKGTVAQFCYVGLQACIWGYSLFIVQLKLPLISDMHANQYFTIGFVLFMAGRFIGAWILSYINAGKLLSIYSICSIILLILTYFLHGQIAIYCLITVNFFISIMYPTIFSLSIQHITTGVKMASSFLVMAMIGGAILPPIMGYIGDYTNNITNGLIVPIGCLIFIAYFALYGHHHNRLYRPNTF